jgi:hypothetical protein
MVKWFLQRCQDYSIEKAQSLQQIMLLKLDIPMQKNAFGSLPHTIEKLNQCGSKT